MVFNQEDIAALAEKIEAIVDSPQFVTDLQDDALRRRLREAGRKLSLAMEVVGDTTHRICKTPLQLPLANIGVEKGIFDLLAQNEGQTLTNETIAEKTKIDPVLTKRLLRYYRSFGMIAQPGDDAYGSNNITKNLASMGGSVGVKYFHETISPALTALPQYLRETGYKNPSDMSYCPWHVGHRTAQSPFDWLQSHPEHMEVFLPWMTVQREGLPIFLDVIDFQKEFAQEITDDSTAVFVDVGGAMGHQCVALKQRHPELRGRIVLQDQAHIIEQVKANPMPGFDGIGVESYDFFTPQTIRGARAYYLRNILHDWPTHKCAEILANIKSGMTEDSVLLIDEMVLPERDAPWRTAQLDMVMMTCFGATERTEAEWRALLDDAGLKITKIWKYTDECEDCVIVAKLKECM